MQLDIYSILLAAVVYFVYGSTCILSIIFTFSLETYQKIEERLSLDIIPSRIISPLETNINWVDENLKTHNKAVGLVLILLSAVEIKFCVYVIKVIAAI